MALIVLVGSSCGRASQETARSDIQIKMTAIPFPAAIGESRLVIQVMDNLGRPIDDASLIIKGDMTHVGMVPVLAEVDGGDAEGVYNVPFEWTMAGDWVVTVEALLADGLRAKERFDISVLTVDDAVCTEHEPEG